MKRALQFAVAVCGLVPVSAGLAGAILGPAMVAEQGNFPISLDSHYRYLSGLLLGIGFAFWSTIPNIERRQNTFRLLTFIVVVGGLSRFYSLMTVGVPDRPMQFALVMELVVTPLLALWQWRVSIDGGAEQPRAE